MEGARRVNRLVAVTLVTAGCSLLVEGCTLVGSAESEGGVVAPPTRPSGSSGGSGGSDGSTSSGGERIAEPPARGGNMDEYELRGRTYRVLDSSRGYDERGIASWYGADFQGRPTSSGEPFDMNLPSAAHRTLPLPAWVRVTNLANGRSIEVRVNDRGPFHEPDRRIIDVSRAAAIQLGMLETGTASVRVQAIEPWQTRGRE